MVFFLDRLESWERFAGGSMLLFRLVPGFGFWAISMAAISGKWTNSARGRTFKQYEPFEKRTGGAASKIVVISSLHIYCCVLNGFTFD